MRRLLAGLSVLAIVITGSAVVVSPTAAGHPQAGAPQGTTFPQTGYTVPPEFMPYWQAHGGLAIFGYPISAVRTEGGYEVQYFERNRFEYHPELKSTAYEVELGLLGTLLTADRTFPKAMSFANTSTSYYFPQTGHSLSGLFLRYWNSHGGLALFGYPISEVFTENGYSVQYFERNRFEYHPEHAGTAYEVQLGLLGPARGAAPRQHRRRPPYPPRPPLRARQHRPALPGWRRPPGRIASTVPRPTTRPRPPAPSWPVLTSATASLPTCTIRTARGS